MANIVYNEKMFWIIVLKKLPKAHSEIYTWINRVRNLPVLNVIVVVVAKRSVYSLDILLDTRVSLFPS